MRKKTVLTFLLLWGVMVSAGFADVITQLDYALRCKQNNNFEQAESIYQDIIVNHPQSHYAAKAKIGLARMYKKLGRYSEAEPLYQQVLASEADNDNAFKAQKHLAILYIASGRDSDASAAIEKLKADFAGYLELTLALNGIARAYQRAGKEAEAKNIYESINTDYCGSYYAFLAHKQLIALGAATETNAAASAAVSQLSDKFPKIETTDVVLPGADEILADINDLLCNYPGYPYLPGIVGRAAEKYFNKASRLEAEGQNSEAQDHYQRAVSVYDVFIEKFSETASGFSHLAGFAYDYAGYCNNKLGDYQKSVNCYQKLVDDFPEHPVAWNGLAMIGRNYEKMEKAGLIPASQAQANIRAAYEELIARYPDCKAAGMANSWLNSH